MCGLGGFFSFWLERSSCLLIKRVTCALRIGLKCKNMYEAAYGGWCLFSLCEGMRSLDCIFYLEKAGVGLLRKNVLEKMFLVNVNEWICFVGIKLIRTIRLT